MATFSLFWRRGINWIAFLVYWILAAVVTWSLEKEEIDSAENFGMHVHLVATIFTTVGYGAVTPTTTWGKIVTIILILTIIPLFLHCLATTANFLNGLLDKLVGARYTYTIEPLEVTGLKIDQKNSGKQANVITANILKGAAILVGLMVIHLSLSAVIHYFTERDGEDTMLHNFGNSIYFEFVSYSTVGFGDIIPTSYYSFPGAFFGTIFFNIVSCIFLATLITRIRTFSWKMARFSLFWRRGFNWIVFLVYWMLAAVVTWSLEEVDEDEQSVFSKFGSYLHFVATIFTTVGYGAIYPITSWGKIVTIIIIVTIIPLFLHCLATTANFLNGLLDKIVGARSNHTIEQLEITGQKTNYMRPGHQVSARHSFLGAAILVGLMAIHLFLSAIIHYFIENNYQDISFWNSIYFEFVTYSTIGFGDIYLLSSFTIPGAFFGTIFFNIVSSILLVTLITRIWIFIQ